MRELEKLSATTILDEYYYDFHNLKTSEKLYLWWRRFDKDDLGRNLDLANDMADRDSSEKSAARYREESSILWNIFKVIEATQQGRFDGYYTDHKNYDRNLMNK